MKWQLKSYPRMRAVYDWTQKNKEENNTEKDETLVISSVERENSTGVLTMYSIEGYENSETLLKSKREWKTQVDVLKYWLSTTSLLLVIANCTLKLFPEEVWLVYGSHY